MSANVHHGPRAELLRGRAVVAPAPSDDEAVAARVARLTVAGYRHAHVTRVLPPPDGAFETRAAALRDVAAGARIWLATVGGVDAGCVRALPRDATTWEVRRLAVAGTFAGRGIGKLLMERVERDAALSGVEWIRLDAVVERVVPPFYASIGYRTVSHWRSDDKLLAEVTMEKPTATPAVSYRHPWEGDGFAASGTMVSYFVEGGRLVVETELVDGDPLSQIRSGGSGGRLFAGADVLPPCDEASPLLGALSSAASERRGDGSLLFDHEPADVDTYVMPRAVDPRALTLWRLPAGVSIPPV